MNLRPKRIILLIASLTTVATIGSTIAPAVYTANASSHSRKKVKKENTKLQLKKDIQSYNQTVSGIADYVNGHFSSSSIDYSVVSPQYDLTYAGIGKSLSNIVSDMNSNDDSYDTYNNNSLHTENSSMAMNDLLTNGTSLYNQFFNRLQKKLSKAEFNNLYKLKGQMQNSKKKFDQNIKNHIDNTDSDYASVWNSIKDFYSELSKDISKL